MRVLVSGASGFIGRRLVQGLAQEHEVFALSRKPAAPAHSIQMDLSVGLDVLALPERIDAVVHLAQSEHYREFPERAEHIYAVNVESTFRLLEYARRAGASRFVLASSGGIYGYAKDAIVESAPPRPPDFYLRSKQLAEILLFAYEKFFGCIAVRPFFVYGAGQRPTMFIPRLVRNVLVGSSITLSPPDGLMVNPIHVTDAVRAFSAAITADFAGPVNIAGADVLSLGEIVRLIGRNLDREPVIEHLAAAPGNVVGDLALMSRVLGPPTVRFSQGVVEVCREAAADLAIEGR
jgi:UDP-glucose 4-epimerase